MGHLTKAKGRVTEVDIQLASQLMDRMQLHGAARTAAQQAFREGKESHFPLRKALQEFRRVCFGRFDLIRIFLEIQLQAAFADGSLHPNERQVLYVIAEELGSPVVNLINSCVCSMGASIWWSWRVARPARGYSQSGYQRASQGPTLEDACKVLG